MPRSDGGGSASEDRVLSGRRPILELLRAGGSIEKILLAEGLDPSSVIGEIRKRATQAGVPVKVVPRAELDKQAHGTNHQGVVALTARYRYAELHRLFEHERPAVLFLDSLTDPHNLGSLLRSADGAGFNGVVLPARRSVNVTAAVRRVAAGAAEVVPVARVNNLSSALDAARKAGLWIVGLDQDAPDDVWTTELLERPVGLVLGSEDRGLSQGVRAHCDGLVSIPSAGTLDSLNVAVAGAVAMFEVARRSTLTGG